MLDDVVALDSNLGSIEYLEIKYVLYNQLILEFLSSFDVDWTRTYRGQRS